MGTLAFPRFTVMREDLSYVLAREYGDARDAATILAALVAIGSTKRVLILSDDGDGTWAMTTNVTIPANVTLSLPAGVTLTGSANLTIVGSLLALRSDWWQSSGTFNWLGSTTPWEVSTAHVGRLALDVPLAIGSGGTGASTVPQAQSNLGIVPGTHVQPYDATLAAFAALVGSANTLAYFTALDALALTTLTPYGRQLIAAIDAPAAQTVLALGTLATLSSVGTTQLQPAAVTYPKFQAIPAERILGNSTGIAAVMEPISIGTGLTLASGVLALAPGGGAGLEYEGDYVPGTYNDGDIVIGTDGIAYMCVKNGTTTPPEQWPGTGIATATGPPGPEGPQGDPGPQGTTGSQGVQGTPGEKWFSGAGVPAGALAGSIIGDWYLNTTNSDVYEKTGASAWTLRANIRGLQGTQGIQGIQGIEGPEGPQGDQGIQGNPGSQGIQGIPGTTEPFRLGHTWALVGDVTALTVLPGMFVPLLGTQAAVLVGIRTKIASGTSIGVQVRRNGSNVGTVITATSTATTTVLGNVALADNDELTLVLSAPVGTPTHFGATLILEHTP